MRPVSSWGRLSAPRHDWRAIDDRFRAPAIVAGVKPPALPFGVGRSYGDVCLNGGGILLAMAGLDRFIAFDSENGILTCEAGVLLRDIQRAMLPRSWSLAVTPGTQIVTVGGAIANDVHGKNHHRFGSFGDHVRRLTLLRTDGATIECGPDERADWFAATCGGLGLTGVILTAQLQLRPVPGPWLDAETIPFVGLAEFFQLSAESEADWEHTVAWIDCLTAKGRGLFMRANPTPSPNRPEPSAKRRAMPLTPPISLVNGLSLRPFNELYYRMGRWRAGRKTVHTLPFMYPLDGLQDWNRMYGPKGFFQYQSVVPFADGPAVIGKMLQEIARSGEGSFLAVLKTFGDRRAPGLLSFARPGVTLALDFPNRGERTLRLFERLDDLLREAGGCLYPAKDARMPEDLFRSGYPNLEIFQTFRDKGLSSAFSRRTMGW